MNSQPTPTPAQEPIRPIPRDGIPKIPTLILFALLTVASAMVGVGLFTAGLAEVESNAVLYGSAGVMILLALFLWRFTRSTKGLIPTLVFAAVVIYYFTSSMSLTAALLSLLFAVAEGGFLLAILPRKQMAWLPVIPMLAYAAALVLTRDPFLAAASLVPFPPMVAMALGTRSSAGREDGMTRVGVICLTSLALGLSLLAALALLAYRALGTLAPDVIMAEMEAIRAALIESITSAEIPEGLDPEMVARLEQLLTHEGAKNTVNSVFNLRPAIFVVGVNVIAAVAHMAQLSTLRTFGFGDSITDRVRAFRMSLISCLIFTASYFIVIFSSAEESTLASTVATNVYLILLPGLALAGLLRITVWLTQKREGGGCLFFLVFLLPLLLFLAPLVLAIAEVIGHVFTSITARIKPPDDSDPSPFD